MRAYEIKPLPLLEVAMNPNSLRQLASPINAQAGMEFEMYVPGAAQPDPDYFEQEQDYGADESANDIEDICTFFHDGDYNDSRGIRRLREKLEEEYNEWATEQRDTDFQNEEDELIEAYIRENDWDEDEELDKAFSQLGFTAEEKDAAKDAGDSAAGVTSTTELRRLGILDSPAYEAWGKATEVVEDVMREKVKEIIEERGSIYDEIKEQWEEDAEWPEQRDWLRENGIRNMSDVESSYDITWPHWTQQEEEGEVDIETVAEKFGDAIGRPVNYGEYHKSKRAPGTYNIEPDGSLDEPNDSGDGGLEFISPPLPIVDMLSDLKKVKAWADETGCYTNESTGLHINVSVPGITDQTLDYVKLALLLGDKYVLEQFGREGNTYCKSALALVKQNVRDDPAKAMTVIDKMRAGLNHIASKAIHSGSTSKFTSINNKEGYIEFRSPGADWLDENFDKIESTLLRMVVALDAAVSPQKYRKEYLTKLYKLLDVSGGNDPLTYFVKYSTGEIPRTAMMSFVKNIQRARAGKTETLYWYVVRNEYDGEIRVVASSPEVAKDAARMAWVVNKQQAPDDTLNAIQGGLYQPGKAPDWKGMPELQSRVPFAQGWLDPRIPPSTRTRVPMQQWVVTDKIYGYTKTVDASSSDQAIILAKHAMGGDSHRYPNSQFTAVPVEAQPADESVIMWTIQDRNTGKHVCEPFPADNVQRAAEAAISWCEANNIPRGQRGTYRVERL